jgi:hypothetical protein
LVNADDANERIFIAEDLSFSITRSEGVQALTHFGRMWYTGRISRNDSKEQAYAMAAAFALALGWEVDRVLNLLASNQEFRRLIGASVTSFTGKK